MKKVFTFPGVDLFNIEDYRKLFYWNSYFQNEVFEIEKQISQKGMLQNYIVDQETDFFTKNLEVYMILFIAAQVSQAKMLEAQVGKPDILLTHSLGEYSAGVYNKTFNYRFAWDVLCTLNPYCLKVATENMYNLLVFGDLINIKRFCEDHNLFIMSVNSPTCALVWFGNRPKFKKHQFEDYQLSHLRFKLLSYPIHTPLFAESCQQALDDLYFHNVFEKYKNLIPYSSCPIVSSTRLKALEPDTMNSLESMAKILLTLGGTQMNLINTYAVFKGYLGPETPFENYILEYSNNFINYLREIDPLATHRSGLLAATERKFKFLNFNFKVQDQGAASSLGDSLGFLNKYF